MTNTMTPAEFVKFVAEMQTPDENDEFTDDDIAMTLGEVIATARQIPPKE